MNYSSEISVGMLKLYIYCILLFPKIDNVFITHIFSVILYSSVIYTVSLVCRLGVIPPRKIIELLEIKIKIKKENFSVEVHIYSCNFVFVLYHDVYNFF